MTPDQIGLVRQSFDMVRPMAGQVAGLFYHRLFEIAPDVAPLFANTNMTSQGHKLMATLHLIVRALSDADLLGSISTELAGRHVGYGVRAEHYAPVGQALVWALSQALGPQFDEETGAAWIAAYTTLSNSMIASAEHAGATAAE